MFGIIFSIIFLNLSFVVLFRSLFFFFVRYVFLFCFRFFLSFSFVRFCFFLLFNFVFCCFVLVLLLRWCFVFVLLSKISLNHQKSHWNKWSCDFWPPRAPPIWLQKSTLVLTLEVIFTLL